ncbi:hypothetical protein PYCCODRAFT_1432505 [Trametes coccinea BRFM310]|uniref:RING-type domain-containing protein n=1 Tax=Trametes coccinea (strain BRFM310) TaxID=1353009 RepID=A0A1Y2IW41_TRAC3|nr:hypothetical protein PYCCODRAFT_1432505 [Trametes coccinea BRFM310]
MPAYLCSICQDHHSLEHLRCLPCGHTYCATCIQCCLRSHRSFPCPSCRRPFKERDPHPIYVDTGDFDSQPESSNSNRSQPCHTVIVHQRIQRATEEVKRVEHDLRRQTVQKAAQEIDKIAELSDGKQDCLLDLLTAVAARWRGMLPVLSQIAEQRSEIMALKDRLKATEVARDEAIAQSAKAEEIAASAVQTTEFVHRALGEVKTEVVRLGNRIEDLQLTHKRELDDKEKVLSRLYDTLKALKEKEAKQKQEIEKLREQAKASAELQIERAASQLHNLDTDGYMLTGLDERGAQELQIDNIEPRFSRLEGSQATFERVSANSSRKRKGSEDDLFVLEENERPGDDVTRHPVGTSQSKRRAVSSRSAEASAPTFKSDWEWRNLAANDKAKTSTPALPLKLDRMGRPLKPVLCGSRMKFNAKS